MTAAMALASSPGVPGVAGKVGVFGKLVIQITLSGVRAGVEEPEAEYGD